MDNKKRTLNTMDICELTGIGRDRVRALILSGVLPNIGSRRRPQVPRAVVEHWLETGELKEAQK
jgi:excisionase family DNA binding protein